jgi:uncharacterized protein YxeA
MDKKNIIIISIIAIVIIVGLIVFLTNQSADEITPSNNEGEMQMQDRGEMKGEGGMQMQMLDEDGNEIEMVMFDEDGNEMEMPEMVMFDEDGNEIENIKPQENKNMNEQVEIIE